MKQHHLRWQQMYWQILLLMIACCVDNSALASNNITGVRTSDYAINQRIMYSNLWLNEEQVTQDYPKTIVIETDYWEMPMNWGSMTTFLVCKEFPSSPEYIMYHHRTMEYLSGEGGGGHSLSRWYPIDIDDDTEAEAVFFEVTVSGGFKPDENEGFQWEKGWQFSDYSIRMWSVDITKAQEFQETILTKELSLIVLPHILNRETDRIFQAWIRYQLICLELPGNSKKVYASLQTLQNDIKKYGIPKDIPVLSGTTVMSLHDIQNSVIEQDMIHVLNPILIFIVINNTLQSIKINP